MTKLLAWLLSHPLTTALGAALALSLGANLITTHVSHGWENRAIVAEASVLRLDTANAAEATQARLRADAAAKAVTAAFKAGAADRQAASVYLTMPTPPPEQQCSAASALVEDALKENAR